MCCFQDTYHLGHRLLEIVCALLASSLRRKLVHHFTTELDLVAGRLLDVGKVERPALASLDEQGDNMLEGQGEVVHLELGVGEDILVAGQSLQGLGCTEGRSILLSGWGGPPST